MDNLFTHPELLVVQRWWASSKK